MQKAPLNVDTAVVAQSGNQFNVDAIESNTITFAEVKDKCP
jgi:hypothetical protein